MGDTGPMWGSLSRARSIDAGIIVLGAVLLLAPAIVNGFPFVYPDTGTYLRSAFQGYVPVDRPYWYGVFLRCASLGGHSFWSMVAVQALLCSLYVLRTVKLFAAPGKVHRIAVLLYAVLAACSSAGYYAGQLMPDVFTAIGILAMVQFLLPGRARPRQVFDALVLLLCCWVHLSHLLIIPLCGGLFLLLMQPVLGGHKQARWARWAACTTLAWLGLGIANFAVDGRFHLSRGGHAFLIARSIDAGLLKPWLDGHCTDTQGLCGYKDDLPPNSNRFLWDEAHSPLYKQGGWVATRSEYDSIMHAMLSDPHYLVRFIGAGLVSTGELLTSPGVCAGLVNTDYRQPNSPPYVMVAGTIPAGLPAYRGSLQNGGRGELDMSVPDRLYTFLLWGSVAAAVVLIIIAPRTHAGLPVRAWLLFVLGAVVISCGVCATLAVVENRYLARVSWLVPLFVGGAVWSWVEGRRTGVSSAR